LHKFVSKTHFGFMFCRSSAGNLAVFWPPSPDSAAIVAQESAGERKWLGDDGSVHEGPDLWSIHGLG
jgi:hypothetical protein